ncbi:metallophosphoesterase family protein [Clostridium sp. B9]|uniref:metallophosphoesterase family protein n=1 Tax=Clostridium sp. B9 TaxID=3423224 RepID=UPI003D2E9E50
MKILHFSDVHFDTPFRELPKEIGDMRRAELRESFNRIISKAIEEKVDLILLAGDLFDNTTVEKSTLIFIKEQMDRAKKYNIKVFIAAGNHDPYNNRSFYSMIDWGDNVYIFNEEIEKVYLEELGVVVYGASFKDKYIRESKLKEFKVDDKDLDLIKIMVLHGEISNASEGEYNPITIREIYESKLDYLALGHVHKFSGISKEGRTSYAYPGCPEGRGFDETGDKGVILGDISNGFVDLEFIKFNKREYFVNELDVSECETKEDILENIKLSIPKEVRMKNLFNIILKGKVKEHLKIDIDLLEKLLKDEFFYCRILNESKIDFDIDELSNEYSIKGIFCSMMKEAFEEEEENPEILELAFNIGMESLLDGEVNLNED